MVLDILDKFSDIVNHSLSSFVSWHNTEKLHWPFFLTRMVWRLWKGVRILLLYNCWSRRCQVGYCLICSWSLYTYTCDPYVYWQLAYHPNAKMLITSIGVLSEWDLNCSYKQIQVTCFCSQKTKMNSNACFVTYFLLLHVNCNID